MTIITPSRRQVIIPAGFGLDVRHMRTAAAAGNGLLNALIAYWPGNEESGNALDMHTNALHLTDTNTVTSATGKVYALARQYTEANGEYHIRPGDDALLSTGDVDFTVATWCYLDDLTADGAMVAKYANADSGEYLLRYQTSSGQFRWYVYNEGTGTVGAVNATTFGAAVVSTWYLVIAYHDSVANKVGICVNNGTVDTADTAGVPSDSAALFCIGRYSASATALFDGRIGPTMFWKSAAAGGGVLTAAQRTALYNAGAGLPYAEFTT